MFPQPHLFASSGGDDEPPPSASPSSGLPAEGPGPRRPVAAVVLDREGERRPPPSAPPGGPPRLPRLQRAAFLKGVGVVEVVEG